MAFSETIKLKVKKLADFTCCWCRDLEKKVEVHHIIPQSEGGDDTLDNAAPLCSNCHTLYGGNPELRKEIKDRRDHWYEHCQAKPQVVWPIGLDVPFLEHIREIPPARGIPNPGIQFTDKDPTDKNNPPLLYLSIHFKNSRYFGDNLPPSNEKWLYVQADMRFALGLRIQVLTWNERDESEFRNFLRRGNDEWNLRSLTPNNHDHKQEDIFHLWRENGENRLLIATYSPTNAVISIHARFSNEVAQAFDEYLEKMGFAHPYDEEDT
jgi:hypothetical protein